MTFFPKWKIFLIVAAIVGSIILVLPNFIGSNKYLPNTKLNYGLDLRGGVQIVLKVDFDTYLHGQLEVLSNLVRKALRKNQVGYKDLQVHQNGLSLLMVNAADREILISTIKKVNRDLEVGIEPNSTKVEIGYTSEQLETLKRNIVEQSREIIRHRIDENGTLEPSIQSQGKLGILLQVPGLQDPSQLKSILGRTAKLSFHLLDEESSIQKALDGIIPKDSMLLRDSEGRPYLIQKHSVVTGDMLTDAQLAHDQYNQPTVAFNFNTIGAKLFGDVTRNSVGKRLAIVLDNQVLSAPNINEPIITGSGQISGNFSVSSANELALLLRAGSLPAPLVIAEEQTVGPSLGEDSVNYGKTSAMIAMLVVVSFMIAMYGIFGIFASVALTCNLTFILAILGLFNATLTMTGIAGIVLTIGMAVDTNILIFERIREEAKHRATINYAVQKGFDLAFATILDSNLTTLIATFFLYVFGSGLVKGFAVTLAIGVLSSMFSAITLTKLFIFKWLKAQNITTPR